MAVRTLFPVLSHASSSQRMFPPHTFDPETAHLTPDLPFLVPASDLKGIP